MGARIGCRFENKTGMINTSCIYNIFPDPVAIVPIIYGVMLMETKSVKNNTTFRNFHGLHRTMMNLTAV